MIKPLIHIVLFYLVLTGSIMYSQWSKINTSGSVPHLKNATAIYDPVGNRMIVFGGRNAAGEPVGVIWSLNLLNNSWVQIIPNGGPNPPARFTHNAYYHQNANAMIIWSGQGVSSALYNDVWRFSFASNSWSLVWPDGNASGVPVKRYGTASVFEPVSGKITTFAGFTANGRFDDTWSFDVNSLIWQERTNSVHPPKRCLHSAVYASDLGKFVIYGGQDTGPLDDIWQCTLSNYQWENITPQIKPPARFWNTMIYYTGGNILIFGGLGTSARNDMWKYRMSAGVWEYINPGATVPAARWGHTGIYIQSEDRMIIFGGEGDSLYKDTWQYSNVSAIGIEPISNVIPKEYKLEQNYPNPFNPVTKIRFKIPNDKSAIGEQMSNVKLEVFDITGGLIVVSVDGILQAGEYEVGFDGSGLPSGVYFYRLSSGSFVQTQKMILLK
ncbi:MAG TPA: kelch repeat-containing protein [Ignavibacteria bacterium]|nr:kelch repeat-containing protein [Ignavibacteria bacterium]